MLIISCFFQAKLLYNPIPFSEDEGKTIKVMIQSNLYRYIGILLEGREKFEEEYLLEIRKRRIEQPGTSGMRSVLPIYFSFLYVGCFPYCLHLFIS